MLTVLEPCDSEYRVRALLLRPRQGVTSLLIGDIRVPAAASYPQFRSLLFFFKIYSLSLLPLFFSFSLSLSLSRSLSLGSALISSRLHSPPPRLHFKWRHCAGAAPRYRQAERNGEGGARAGAIARSWCFITAPHLDIWGRLFSHEHQCVINRINLGPNFLMIAVLMYVNECSLLTHYRQFAWDTHNQTL